MESSDCSVKKEGVAATTGAGLAAPAQNNVADIAEQPTPGESRLAHNSWRAHTAAVAPWIIQSLWLAATGAAVGYLKSRNWGFEGIPYVVAILLAVLGWLAWSITWTILARQSIGHRLAFFVISVAAVLIVADLILEWRRQQELQLLVTFARIAVGFAVPLTLVAWRGWRLQWQPSERLDPSQPTSRLGQFSIGELLLLTAGAAVFLGLMLARENFNLLDHWQEIAAECLIVVCGTLLVLVGLRVRRFAKALIACPLIATAFIAVAIAMFEPAALGRPGELLLVALIFGPAVTALLIAMGLARWWGYRLVAYRHPEPIQGSAL